MPQKQKTIGVAKRLWLRLHIYQSLRVGLLLVGMGLFVFTLLPHDTISKKPLPKKDVIIKTATTHPSITSKTTTSKTTTKTKPKSTTTTPATVSKPAVTTPKVTHKITPKVVTPAPSSSVHKLTPTSSSPPSSGSSGGSGNSGGSGGSGSSGSGSSSPQVSYTSTNWSGYLASGGTFTSVSGTWTAPDPSGNGSTTSADATWIGIGGVTSDDLIQIGTDNTVSRSGQVTAAAFYELLPNASITIPDVTVSPGDAISASVSQVSTGEWTITLTDDTDGQTFSDTVAYTSSYSSAEWIEEDPSYGANHLIPFDDFGTVTFDNASDIVNGDTETIANSGPATITMLNGSGKDEAVPTVLNTDGNSFTVNWSSGS